MHTTDAGGAPVDRPVRPVAGVVLDRNGWPTLIVRGNEEAHVKHAGAKYLYDQAALDEAVRLAMDAACKQERDRWMSVACDGWRVLQGLDERAQKRTSHQNVGDVLDALVRVIRGPNVESTGSQRDE